VKNEECAACLKYSVLIFVEKNIYNATSVFQVAFQTLKDEDI
jgi:hypothetical protein